MNKAKTDTQMKLFEPRITMHHIPLIVAPGAYTIDIKNIKTANFN